jgi:nitrous oxide reductase accessory protein NosL
MNEIIKEEEMSNFVDTFKVGFLGFIVLIALSLTLPGCVTQHEAGEGSSMHAQVSPQTIPDDARCGKCGMYPARYPKWQSQIIFADGSMTPFDGCKCMFGFLFNMEKYDQKHTADDVAAVLVKDFNSGRWVNAKDASFVVGSKEMGPMGKELIPFSDHMEALNFQKAKGGELMRYDDISMAALKPLMGGMKHMKKMKM